MIHVLIISYDFPPVGGIGVQRVIKWIKYFNKFEIEPIVLTNEHGLGFVRDDSLLDYEYLKKLKVYRLGGKQLKKYHELKKSGNLFTISNILLLFKYVWFMDIYSSWFFEIKGDIQKIVLKEQIHCILTTSPPHSTHLFGNYIKKEFGIPWIMDLRDSMTEWPLRSNNLMTKFISFLESFYEKNFYSTADKVIFATANMQKHAKCRVKELPEAKSCVIRNGFDPDDFKNVRNVGAFNNNNFNIIYTGTIHPRMDPKPFTNALIYLIKNKKIPENNITVQIVGEISKDKKDILKNLNNYIAINFVGHVNHQEAIQYQISADLLLLFMPSNSNEKEILTGKVFEYIGSGNPIFALASDGELKDLIQKNNFGYVANPRNQDEIVTTLLTAYENWKQDIDIVSGSNREQFTRECQCKILSNIIKEVNKSKYNI